MGGLTILDVALGLVFIYLVLSLAVTAVNELIAGILRLRARTLSAGIARLLADPEWPKLAAQFYAHPMVAGLHEDGQRPSYVPARTFSMVMLDLVLPAQPGVPRTLQDVHAAVAKLPDGSAVRRVLSMLLTEAEGDLARFQSNVEIWFNSGMDRVSGGYRRRTQSIVFAIGLLVTVLANADTLRIADRLARNASLRAALVAEAQAFAQSPPPRALAGAPQGTASVDTAQTAVAAIGAAVDRLSDAATLGVPLGWNGAPMGAGGPLEKVIGLLLTAVAISLGAPFWFDVLNKVVAVRSAGRSPDEVAKSPEAAPKRLEEQPPR